ncbi:MAG: nuclear transport factor 2 family protein [Polyangiaceae bacterium]|nr:nuclear transport factor 2 family protein [Polyangiaceae bacterium]
MSTEQANAQLIQKFYDAFQRRDAETMGSCYADDVHFSDAAFPDLRGERARNMWRMLCARAGADFTIEVGGVEGDARGGKAHWEAWYTFVRTGRKVHNVIDARFEIENGRIVRHVDTFDFPRWARQAFGPVGLLLGWTSFFRKKVQAQTDQLLTSFIAKR